MSDQMSKALKALTDYVVEADVSGRDFKSNTLDKMIEIFEMRKWCLEMAHSTRIHTDPNELVEAARIYEAYLDGSSDKSDA